MCKNSHTSLKKRIRPLKQKDKCSVFIRPVLFFRRIGAIVLSISILIMIGEGMCGCAKATFVQAKEKQERGEYFTAANLYRKIYTQTPSKEKKKRGEAAFGMGECYRKINFLSRALGGYQNAIRYKVQDSIASLRMAQVVYMQGKYDQSIQLFEEYLSLHPNSQEALSGLLGAKEGKRMKENPTRYVVRKDKFFNSRRADFSPVLVGENSENLYYTSSNDRYSKNTTKNPVTGMKNFDIFFSRKNEKGQWIKPEPIEGELNTDGDEGVVTLSNTEGKMYLSVCKGEEEGYGKVFLATSRKDGERWGKATPFYLWGDSTLTIAHPALSPDENYLYFVSDKLGGYGGKDIWRVCIENGTVGTPENLGTEINTAGDEMFPSFRSNGVFYFSSNGRGGLGGLDIFRATLSQDGEHWRVENMGYPINFSGDDFGITFDKEGEKGFFSSNRGDGKGWEHIYSFELPPTKISVEGFVVDREDYILPQATIRVVGNDGTILKTKPKVDGTYSITLDYGKDYIMQATAKNYLGDQHQISTLTDVKDTAYIQDFLLTPMSQSVSIENVFYEFGQAVLLSSSYEALNELAEMMKRFPDISIELSSHTDRKGNATYNEALSLKRAEAVVEYLVQRGIAPKRMTAKGYGASQPKKIGKKVASQYPNFLHEGDVLTEEFILSLLPEQQEIADQLNRRTEFKVY